MEHRLLLMARDNYNQLKKEFNKLLVENEYLRAESKNSYNSEVMYLKALIKQSLNEINKEKLLRDKLYENFKDKTVRDLKDLYENEVTLLESQIKTIEVDQKTLNDVVKGKENDIDRLKVDLREQKKVHLKEIEVMEEERVKEISKIWQEFREKTPVNFFELTSKVSSLTTELEQTKSHLTEIQKLNNECQSRVRELDLNSQRYEMLNELLKSDLTKAEQRREEMEQQILVHEKECQSRIQKFMEREEMLNDDYNQIQNQMEFKISSLETKLNSAQSQLKSSNVKGEELHRLREENEVLRKKLGELKLPKFVDKKKKNEGIKLNLLSLK